MIKVPIFICVQKDMIQMVNWSLDDFNGMITIKHCQEIAEIPDVLENVERGLLFLDSVIDGEATIKFAKELKVSKPGIMIILLVSSGTSKEELLEIITLKLMTGILVRPFSATQVSDYIYKCCGFQKPSNNPFERRV